MNTVAVVMQSGPSNVLSPRDRLKIQLHAERRQLVLGKGWAPICALCGEPMWKPGDLHEAIIPRGKAMGPLQSEIYTRFNCVEVHHRCHMRIVGTGGFDQFTKCVRYLAKYEGRDNIEYWLRELGECYPAAVEEALARLKLAWDYKE